MTNVSWNVPQLKMSYFDSLFYLTNSLNPNDILFSVIYDWKSQHLKSSKLQMFGISAWKMTKANKKIVLISYSVQL